MLTEKGEEIGFRLDQTIKNVFKQANDWTSEEDRKIMYKSLNSISESLQKIYDNYGE